MSTWAVDMKDKSVDVEEIKAERMEIAENGDIEFLDGKRGKETIVKRIACRDWHNVTKL
jgi:hypothetical protein